MKNENEYNSDEGFSFAAINEITDAERLSKNGKFCIAGSELELMSVGQTTGRRSKNGSIKK